MAEVVVRTDRELVWRSHHGQAVKVLLYRIVLVASVAICMNKGDAQLSPPRCRDARSPDAQGFGRSRIRFAIWIIDPHLHLPFGVGECSAGNTHLSTRPVARPPPSCVCAEICMTGSQSQWFQHINDMPKPLVKSFRSSEI